MYCVYAIGQQEDLSSNNYSSCYVGVTNNPVRRWKAHQKSKYTVGKYIRSELLTFENNFKIIYEGSEDSCYEMEESLRPIPRMGLNEAVGGLGGYTIYDEQRNQKISKALKGRSKTSEHVRKVVDSRGSYGGEKNPNSKQWVLVSPSGTEHRITGTLQKFCEDNNLLRSCLMRYRGKKVPQINTNSYGGYRPKNARSLLLRENSVGWTLY